MAEDRASPARRTTALPLLALVGALAFACGMLAGRLGREDASTSRTEARTEEFERIALAIEALRTDLAHLRQSIDSTTDTTLSEPLATQRERVAVGTESEAIVQRLEQALLRLERFSPLSAQSAANRPGLGSIADIEREAVTRTNPDTGDVDRALSRAHLLWTIDDLVARYGMPNSVSGIPSMRLVYGFGGDVSEYPRRSVTFLIGDGRVTSAFVELD